MNAASFVVLRLPLLAASGLRGFARIVGNECPGFPAFSGSQGQVSVAKRVVRLVQGQIGASFGTAPCLAVLLVLDLGVVVFGLSKCPQGARQYLRYCQMLWMKVVCPWRDGAAEESVSGRPWLISKKEWPSTLLHGHISALRTALFF